MTDSHKKYLNDPDLADEPAALREIHAIRLKIRDETKDMTPEKRAECVRQKATAIMDKYGLAHLVVDMAKAPH